MCFMACILLYSNLCVCVWCVWCVCVCVWCVCVWVCVCVVCVCGVCVCVCVCVCCVCVCGVKSDILFHTCHLHFECYVRNNFQDDDDG